jgi:hypothetical protein
MMNLHFTGSYLETLWLLWQSPYISSNSLADEITSLWKLLRKLSRVHAFGAFSLSEKTAQWALTFLAKPLPFT